MIFLILDASFVLGQFGPFLQNFARAASAGTRIDAVLREPMSDASAFKDGGIKLEKDQAGLDISLENVTFAYPSRDTTTVLKDINMSIKAGDFVALVGSSGSGKSTISSLLLRYYDPVAGSIKLNGQDLKDLNLNDIRDRIGVVTQQPTLFPGTILENIAFGLDGESIDSPLTKEKCVMAAKAAEATKFIDKLPKGFDTLIGSGGSTQLSGGQLARIALARALVRNPDILILDEFTAALVSFFALRSIDLCR